MKSTINFRKRCIRYGWTGSNVLFFDISLWLKGLRNRSIICHKINEINLHWIAEKKSNSLRYVKISFSIFKGSSTSFLIGFKQVIGDLFILELTLLWLMAVKWYCDSFSQLCLWYQLSTFVVSSVGTCCIFEFVFFDIALRFIFCGF